MSYYAEHDKWALYGSALLDYFEGRRDAMLVAVREDGRRVNQPASIYFDDMSTFSDLDRIVLDHCKGEVLDVGGGAGRHSLVLQRMGFSVRSIDISPQAVDVMKRQGVRRAELRALNNTQIQSYDTILMLMNGIGIVETLCGLQRFLAWSAFELQPDSQILLDSWDFRQSTETIDRIYFRRPLCANIYSGETSYKLEYRGETGAQIPWLFIDEDTLGICAKRNGFDLRILSRESSGKYAAKLTLLA